MWEQIITRLPHPTLLLSPAGQILAANTMSGDLFGPDLVGRGYLVALRHPKLVDAIESCLSEKSPTEARFEIVQMHTNRSLHAQCDPVEGAGVHVLVQFQDLSDFSQNMQMKRDFVANVSHELKSPLTAMSGFIETLQGPAKDDPETRTRFLGIMSDETGRMSRMVDDLLSLSRLEQDSRRRPSTRVDIAEILQSVVMHMSPRAKDVGMALNLDVADAVFKCRADKDQVRQVFTNLIDNGLKYGRSDRGLCIGISCVNTDIHVSGPAIRADFQDFGNGFDPVHIPRLGERFYRIDSHRARHEGGTGLGLAIVKHILNRHRGALRIQSEMGKGSMFSVIIPTT